MNVLITGARAPISLDLAKTLAVTGHRVWTSDSVRCPIGAASPHAQGYCRTPPPRQAFDAFAQALQAFCDRTAIDLVIPTSEEVFWLAQAQARGLLRVPVRTSSLSTLLALHDKFAFSQLAQTMGFGAGRNHRLTRAAEVQALDPAVDWVLKPVFSRFASRTLISPSTAQRRRVRPSEQDPWLAQQRAWGPECCTYNLAEDGHLLLHVAYRPTWRAGQGAGVYFEPHHDARLQAMAAALAARLRLSGQFALDVIDTGERLVALECNPRGTSGAHLAAQFPEAFSAALLGQRPATGCPSLKPLPTRPAMLEWPLRLYHPVRALYGPLRADIRRARDCVTDAGVGRWPALLATGEMVGRALRLGCNVLAATTHDIEWNRTDGG